MDLTMNIAQLSVDMHEQRATQSLGIAALKMSIDSSSEALALIEEVAAESLDPNLGNSIDIYA